MYDFDFLIGKVITGIDVSNGMFGLSFDDDTYIEVSPSTTYDWVISDSGDEVLTSVPSIDIYLGGLEDV